MRKPTTITHAHLDAQTAVLRGDIRDFAKHVSKRFGTMEDRLNVIEQRLEGIEGQLEAIREMLVFRKEFQNLVRELRAGGIRLDEGRIFIT